MLDQILKRFGNDDDINFESVQITDFDFKQKPEREYYDGPDGEFIDSKRFHLFTEKKGWLVSCCQTAKRNSSILKPHVTDGQDVASYIQQVGLKKRRCDGHC